MSLLALLLLLTPGNELQGAGPSVRQDRPEFAARVAEEALAFAQGEAQKLPGTYRIRLLQAPAALPVFKGEPRIESVRLSKAEPSGRFFVSMKLVADGRPVGFARIDLEGTWSGNLVRARESLPRKAVPDPTQLESTPFEGTPPPGALTTFPEGMRLRQPVTSGKVLTHADLEPIPLVLAGERVRLTAAAPGLSILVEGTARSTGGQGERVRVEIVSTRKLVQAIVSGQNETRLVGFDQAK